MTLRIGSPRPGLLALVACAALACVGGTARVVRAATEPPATPDSTPAAQVPPAAAAVPRAVTHPEASLLEAIAKAAGGRDAVSAWKCLVLRGKVLPLIEGPTSTVRVELDLAGSMREETRDASGVSVHWLDGPLAWSGPGPHAKAASAEVAADIRFRFHELAAPFELADAVADSLEDLGPTPEKWNRLVRRFGAERIAYDVDPATGELRRVTRLEADGRPARAATELEDFREIGGVRLPFRWTSIVDGRALSEIIVERIERVDDARPEAFLPPGVRGGL
ncbi:MAG: hypothetical protein U0167_18805 [bacterium]